MTELALNNLFSFILGGGLLSTITALVTVKYTKTRAQADAMKAMQDVYQELIEDLRKDKIATKQDKEDTEKRLSAKIEAMALKVSAMEKRLEEYERERKELKSLKCTDLICLNRKK